MLTTVATKSLKFVIFNHFMLVDANCDDSVTIIQGALTWLWTLKVSVALGKKSALMRTFRAPPYFKSWIHP